MGGQYYPHFPALREAGVEIEESLVKIEVEPKKVSGQFTPRKYDKPANATVSTINNISQPTTSWYPKVALPPFEGNILSFMLPSPKFTIPCYAKTLSNPWIHVHCQIHSQETTRLMLIAPFTKLPAIPPTNAFIFGT